MALILYINFCLSFLKFLPIFLLKVSPNSLYKFLLIFFIFKKLSFILLFISKCYLLLVKFLLLFDFLFFLGFFLGQDLSLPSFDTFINKIYIKNLISSFVLYFFYIIDLLLIINCLV